jgi:hypothetical protein
MPGPWRLFSLSIRDLLWLVLLAASLTIWVREHHQRSEQIDKLDIGRWLISASGRADEPSQEQRERQALAAKLARLSDEQLTAHLTFEPRTNRGRSDDLETYWAEMARRGLDEPLRRQLEADRFHSERLLYENLEVLTALRRAEAQPDPLLIKILPVFRETAELDEHGVWLEATVANVDVRGETIIFVQGGDYRGGRRERWQFLLTDEWGRTVGNSNYLSPMGGGLMGTRALRPGESIARNHEFDLRRYVAPPRSGKYWLQAFYHNWQSIAGDRDFTGLIVSKSAPMAVTVTNPVDQNAPWLPAEVRPIAAIVGLGVLFLFIALASEHSRAKRATASSTSSPRLWWRRGSVRDLCWGVLILAVAVGFWIDCQSQMTTIARMYPDKDAKWTLHLGHHE